MDNHIRMITFSTILEERKKMTLNTYLQNEKFLSFLNVYLFILLDHFKYSLDH